MTDHIFAFPSNRTHDPDGMELRDYFAAKAIPQAAAWEAACPTDTAHSKGIPQMSGIARKAYQLADAFMEERKR